MNTPQQEPVQEQPAFSFGQRLQTARRALNMSREEVAAEMRLGIDIVTALEEEELEQLGAPIFVTGYLKKYASLLKIPAEPILAAYKQVQKADPELVLHTTHRRPSAYNKLFMRLVSWGIAIVLLISLASWVQMQDFSLFTDLGQTTTVNEEPAGELLAPLPAVDDNVLPETGTGGAEQLPAQVIDEPAASVEPEQAPVPEVVKPETVIKAVPETVTVKKKQVITDDVLVLHYREDSWTEVSDSKGKRLLYDLYRAGIKKRVSGDAPFEVFLGNAQGVRIEYNGKSYDFSRHVEDNLARFKLGKRENHDG